LNLDGDLYGFGINSDGQLGMKQLDLFTPSKIDFPVFENKEIVHICCGGYHTICVTNSVEKGNQVWSWGRNYFGI
jgi:alpha-tubulin suppressor-like RCC1 family protein